MSAGRWTLALFLLISGRAGVLHACQERPLERDSAVLQVRAKELWIGDGRKLANGVLIVEAGKIRRAGADLELDPRFPVIEHDGVVTAGMVACQTRSGAADELLDDTRTVLPLARAVDVFDPEHPDFERALASGITTVLLTPSGSNLVGGVAAAVKTAGGEVVNPEAALAISFSSNALGRSTSRSFFFFEGSGEEAGHAHPADDGHAEVETPAELDEDEPEPKLEAGGPETTGISRRGSRAPTSYTGALSELGARFTKPEGVFARAAERELPVFLEAWDRNEVVRAAEFAKAHGLAGAVWGAPLASDPDVLAALAGSGLGVIVGPYALGQARRSLESVGRLAEKNVPVGFALDSPAHHPEELRLSAAMALSAGASADSVWKALSADGARLANAAERVGTLEPGKDADFVLWSGDPLALTSAVEAVYVSGKRAWPRETGARAGRGVSPEHLDASLTRAEALPGGSER